MFALRASCCSPFVVLGGALGCLALRDVSMEIQLSPATWTKAGEDTRCMSRYSLMCRLLHVSAGLAFWGSQDKCSDSARY